VAELASYVGKEVGVSDWLEVSQERINQFADATETGSGSMSIPNARRVNHPFKRRSHMAS
jgi:hypothetical protein